MEQLLEWVSRRTIHISWWEVAILAVLVSGISRLIATKSSKKSQEFYATRLKQAPWSPPGWLFAPAWIFNNYFLLWAFFKILHMQNGSGRNSLLYMQAFIWLIFYSFDYVYFNRKSPILAAIWTKSDSMLALVSFLIAFTYNRHLAYCYIPLSLWTLFASTVADYQALYNGDPVFKTKPLLDYFKKQ